MLLAAASLQSVIGEPIQSTFLADSFVLSKGPGKRRRYASLRRLEGSIRLHRPLLGMLIASAARSTARNRHRAPTHVSESVMTRPKTSFFESVKVSQLPILRNAGDGPKLTSLSMLRNCVSEVMTCIRILQFARVTMPLPLSQGPRAQMPTPSCRSRCR